MDISRDKRLAAIQKILTSDPDAMALDEIESYLADYEAEAQAAEQFAADRETWSIAFHLAHTRVLVRALRRALREKELARAVGHAVLLGIHQGILQILPYRYHARRKVIERSRKGGLRNRKPVTDEQLAIRFLWAYRREPTASWTELADKAAVGQGLTGRTVRERLKAHPVRRETGK